MLPKIRALRAIADDRGLSLDIEVDGGIKVDNVDRVVARVQKNVVTAARRTLQALS